MSLTASTATLVVVAATFTAVATHLSSSLAHPQNFARASGTPIFGCQFFFKDCILSVKPPLDLACGLQGLDLIADVTIGLCDVTVGLP